MAKTLTISVMDAPYESETTTTLLRVVDAALDKGHNVNVFCYEGAVSITMSGQKAHPNPVKGTSADEADHFLPSKFVAGLFKKANGRLDWIN